MKKPGVVRVAVDRHEGMDPTLEDGRWSIYTFHEGTSHDIGEGVFLRGHPDFEEKLGSGLAWRFETDHCGYYEIDGDVVIGEDCCGVIIWEGDESDLGSSIKVDRKTDAEQELGEFNSWVLGDVYKVSVAYIKSVAPNFRDDDPDFNGAYWEEIDSDSSLYGSDQVEEFVKEALSEHIGCRVVVRGDAAEVFGEFETDRYEPEY